MPLLRMFLLRQKMTNLVLLRSRGLQWTSIGRGMKYAEVTAIDLLIKVEDVAVIA